MEASSRGEKRRRRWKQGRRSTRRVRCNRLQRGDRGLKLGEAGFQVRLPAKQIIDLRRLRLQLLEDGGGVVLRILVGPHIIIHVSARWITISMGHNPSPS